jgi:hypothetical protein
VPPVKAFSLGQNGPNLSELPLLKRQEIGERRKMASEAYYRSARLITRRFNSAMTLRAPLPGQTLMSAAVSIWHKLNFYYALLCSSV